MTILFNLKEEKITDVTKLKKRKQGRCLKISIFSGNFYNIPFFLEILKKKLFSIFSGNNLFFQKKKDALVFYNQAAEILKSNSDFLWHGGTLEGIAAVLISKFYLQKELTNGPTDLESIQKDKMNEQVKLQ